MMKMINRCQWQSPSRMKNEDLNHHHPSREISLLIQVLEILYSFLSLLCLACVSFLFVPLSMSVSCVQALHSLCVTVCLFCVCCLTLCVCGLTVCDLRANMCVA
ncbi:uncharacterized protein [Triticum aestivum]|uniref:uncharacterized protein n=1 Tax=Triticum aestivum TaxID=4565 RepID=UPI001D005BC7|nr:uncharacterized protein LOC123103677 [Triticum aestivum]